MKWVEVLALILAVIGIAGVSKRIRNTVLTLPILCVLFGLGVGLLFRRHLVLSLDHPLVQIIATLTLVMLLATDASRISLKSLVRYHDLPIRLLLIGLPLTVALGTVLGNALFGKLLFWEAAVLAVTLAPTDGTPAASAMNNPRVPVRIRQALDIEGDLNDGITLPLLLLTVLMAATEGIGGGSVLWFAARKVVFGVAVGVVIGYLGARYIQWGQKSDWMASRFQKTCAVALVLLTYGLAEWVGGNGTIAAFAFGLTLGHIIGPHGNGALYRYAEVENSTLILVTYVFFGMLMLPPALEAINPTVVLYALLSLTVIRMLPVAVSLIGARLRPLTVLYVGWFGPRGIATILYVLTVFGLHQVAARKTIDAVAVITVFLSVILHGLSAAPLAEWYGARIAELDKQSAASAETAPVPEMPTRAATAHDEIAGARW